MAFKKGQSGNPGGRAKVPRAVGDLAKAHTREAIDRLAYWLHSDDARASVSAATALLDRAWGRPTQSTQVSGIDGKPIAVSLEVIFGRAEKS